MQAFEIGHFGRVAAFDQGFKTGADEFHQAAAENSLFAEQVCFALFLEGGFDDAELSRAVFEGVAYSARLAMESLEASACLRPADISHSGGGASSDIWCQIRADVLGRPIKRMKIRDAGVLGAALMAGTGIRVFGSLREAAKEFVSVDRVFEPDAHEMARHDVEFEKYKLLYKQLAMLRS